MVCAHLRSVEECSRSLRCTLLRGRTVCRRAVECSRRSQTDCRRRTGRRRSAEGRWSPCMPNRPRRSACPPRSFPDPYGCRTVDGRSSRRLYLVANAWTTSAGDGKRIRHPRRGRKERRTLRHRDEARQRRAAECHHDVCEVKCSVDLRARTARPAFSLARSVGPAPAALSYCKASCGR